MVFKKLKARFGGGTTLQTHVHTPVAQPGGLVNGVVEIVGGEFAQDIRYLALAAEARVEVEHGDGESRQDMRFAHQHVAGQFVLHPGQRIDVPFGFALPLETPFNVIAGSELRGVRLGLRTELEIAKSLDKGDWDPIRVEPLPAQRRILDALVNIGCRFKSADLERGRIPGSVLDFYQEVEFYPPPEFSHAISELEVTFLTFPHGMDVLLEGDRRGGFLDSGGDRIHRLSIGHEAIAREDWESVLRHHLHELGRRRGFFG
ncbi:sporulation protein [Pseudonocardia sp.]|uniref:sporulation protein n=1 Tax=Pseudonocardia sp. TaxID=60912 RepID=UPI003D0C1BF2